MANKVSERLQFFSLTVSIIAVMVSIISAINSMISMRLVIYGQVSRLSNILFFTGIIVVLVAVLALTVYMFMTTFRPGKRK